MVANVSFNPNLTTTAAGSFNTTSLGLTQGSAYDDPAVRYALSGGVLSTSETLPMWGGVGIYNLIPGVAGAQEQSLGEIVGRANSLTGANALTAFSVYQQAYGMLTTPQSPVPLSASSMQVNFYRLGSGARIHVAIDPALVSLDGSIITSQVSWDFSLQRLIPFVAAYPANVITAAAWANTNGGQATLTTTTAHTVTVGSDFTITGVTPAAYNGTFTALAGTTGSTLVYALPLASTPGAGTAFGTLVAGGGALNVRVLETQIGNSMTVSYDPVTGFATWNRSGSAATILI
jgi:hypothetical protein